ncbi:MAG: hypothetical protein GX418_00515 [Clostridiales bacterium]|nr:hypothetical protein [Clostridiales bacterium]
MRTMPKAAPPAEAEPKPAPDTAARGCLTNVALGEVRRLCRAPAPDPLGYPRPPLDRAALALSLELAYMTYTLDLEPWMRAGWTDISIQVDNLLQSGVTVGESESASSENVRALINAWKVARARMALREHNPLAQIRGAFRQREKSDTIKAVTMLHPAGRGRYVVAIGFMGTGSRFYDWFSNFRFTTENGFHKGFAQLTDCFEQSADRILFPGAAAALGLPRLTLRNILADMRSPDSRFSLWMAGHSQGAAVMQVFCHRLLEDWGVLPGNIVGYGFASPTTAAGDTGRAPGSYPLFHVLNSEDLVPRVGALKHLGLCLRYRADDALRDAAYGWSAEPDAARERAEAETLLRHVEDTPTMLETLAAFCETMIEEKTEESLNALMEKRWSIPPLDKAFSYAGDKAGDTLKRMARYARVAYRSVSGRRMEEGTVAALRAEMAPVFRAHTVRALLGMLATRLHPPHMLSRAHRQPGSYGYIVTRGGDRLEPFVWEDVPGGLPAPRQGKGYAAFAPVGRPGAGPRAAKPRRPAGRSARNRGIGALRAGRQTRCVHDAVSGRQPASCAVYLPSVASAVRGLLWPRRRKGRRG